MAHFSTFTALSQKIHAQKAGSVTIANVQCRNELGEATLWEDFSSFPLVQLLKAELKTPTDTVVLERHVSQFEIGVPLINNNLNLKLLPDLTINIVQRDDLDCQEGDRIVAVDGVPVSSIEELRVKLQGKSAVSLVVENGGSPLFTIHDPTTPYWEVTSVPATTVVKGTIKPGDLVLRINDESVAGLDTRTALDSNYAKISILSGSSLLAQRIKTEGMMSFTTQVEVGVSKNGTEHQYNITLNSFEPAMFGGVYVVGIYLGRHQIGRNFDLEIVEGQADAKRSELVREGLWQTVAGKPLQFKLVCYDSAGNRKCKGGDRITCTDGVVTDLGNGSYDIVFQVTQVGNPRIQVTVNGEKMQGSPEVDVSPAEMHPPQCTVSLVGPQQAFSPNKAGVWSVNAGTNAVLMVKLCDQYGNPRPRDREKVRLIQRTPCFHQTEVMVELPCTSTGLGTYEFRGLVSCGSTTGPDGEMELAELMVTVNGQQLREEVWRVDVLPGDVCMENCLATVTPAGIVSKAGETFEFEVIVRDVWNNARNHTTDEIQLLEYTPANTVGEPWANCEVTSTGHGTYRISSSHTIARQSRFTFSVNHVTSKGAKHVHTLNILPSEISIEQCVVTGETTANVGQYVALLIALRDQYSNICKLPPGAGNPEISVVNVQLVKGDIDAANLRLVTRVSEVEYHAGMVYTHQVVLSTEQAVELTFDLVLGSRLMKKCAVTFKPEQLAEQHCTVEALPLTIVAGEEFAFFIQLQDSYRNGLSGLEQMIQIVIDSDTIPPESSAITKLPSADLGQGRYQIRARILLAREALPIKVVFGSKTIWKAVMEVLPAAAKASRCEVECPEESRVQFPVEVHGLFRDEFGNVAPSEADVLQVRLDGCLLKATDALLSMDRLGHFFVMFTPKRDGEVRVQVQINREKLMEQKVLVRGLSSWTREDASRWVLSIGNVDPAVSQTAAQLAQEFVRQNVTGAKIAGGLLDRGALHFAFGIEDMSTAELFAKIIHDLNRGIDAPQVYPPLTWTSAGNPRQLIPLMASDMAFQRVAEEFMATMPAASVMSIHRVENAHTYAAYDARRNQVAYKRGGDPKEQYLWYGSEAGVRFPELIENGFTQASLPQDAEHMYLGRGFYFAKQASLADHIMNLSLTAKGASPAVERKLVFARVIIGSVTKSLPILRSKEAGALREALKRPPNRLPPHGAHTLTGWGEEELLTFEDHTAYPEFLVTYRGPFRGDLQWPNFNPDGAGKASVM